MKSKIAAILTSTALVAVATLALAFGASAKPPLEVLSALPALNTAGDSVFASVSVSDGTGVVTTVTTAATYYTVGGAAPLVAGEADGSGCITYTLATNRFTVAAACGRGKLLLRACLNDVIGANDATVNGRWFKGASTAASPIALKIEGATAARGNVGCVETIVNATAVGDTYDFRYTSGTNADTVTTRNAYFSVRKIANR